MEQQLQIRKLGRVGRAAGWSQKHVLVVKHRTAGEQAGQRSWRVRRAPAGYCQADWAQDSLK